MHNGNRAIDPSHPADQYLLLKNTTYSAKIAKTHDCNEFEYAFQQYLMRRGRRIFLQQHNIMQVYHVMSKRWNRFASNTMGLIKNEHSIQEELQYGLDNQTLLTIAQLAFKRRQTFVTNALAQRKKYEVYFGESVDSKFGAINPADKN